MVIIRSIENQLFSAQNRGLSVVLIGPRQGGMTSLALSTAESRPAIFPICADTTAIPLKEFMELAAGFHQ